MSNDASPSAPAVRRRPSRALLMSGGLMALVVVLSLISIVGSRSATPSTNLANEGNLLVLALPAFLAGLLSFLSPCCLPVLSAYFAFTFQMQRERVLMTTIAFFFGLATTMVLLGASASLVSRLLFNALPTLTLVGGMIVIGFGVMSVLGKGFSGISLLNKPNASVVGSYVYGATFALGWTACVGPILGALLTMMAAQGVAVLQGAALAFIYALGLGLPLIIVATWFSRFGHGTQAMQLMRGRGFDLNLGFTTLHLHTTSVISGVLMIAMGVLLATGQMTELSRWAAGSPLSRLALDLEAVMRGFLLGH